MVGPEWIGMGWNWGIVGVMSIGVVLAFEGRFHSVMCVCSVSVLLGLAVVVGYLPWVSLC